MEYYYKDHSASWWRRAGYSCCIFSWVTYILFTVFFVIWFTDITFDELLFQCYHMIWYHIVAILLLISGVCGYINEKKAISGDLSVTEKIKQKYMLYAFLSTGLMFFIDMFVYGIPFLDNFIYLITMPLFGGLSLICLICAVILLVKKRRALYLQR